MNYNGKYLFLPAKNNKNACFVSYNGGSDTNNWLNFCYDIVAPSSRLIDIVSVQNVELPRYFNDVDIIVDDEGLFSSPHPDINSFSSFLYGNLLVGDVILGFVAYDAVSEGNHVFPLSEHPYFDKIVDAVKNFLDLESIPMKEGGNKTDE